MLNFISLVLIVVISLYAFLTIHELGHFVMCKAFRVHTFSMKIGKGPKLLTLSLRDFKITLHLYPFAGNVIIAKDSECQKDEAHLFDNKTRWQKAFICLGGPISNILVGYFILVIIQLIPGFEKLHGHHSNIFLAAIEFFYHFIVSGIKVFGQEDFLEILRNKDSQTNFYLALAIPFTSLISIILGMFFLFTMLRGNDAWFAFYFLIEGRMEEDKVDKIMTHIHKVTKTILLLINIFLIVLLLRSILA